MSKSTCTVEGCDREFIARGLCTTHYSRLRRCGSTDDPHHPRPGRHPGSAEERFWSKVEKTETCWLWTGSVTDRGYGQFWHVDGRRGAHRMSWELANGEIPDDMVIDHICHVKHCVRPSHLRLATVSQNRQNHTGGTDYPTQSGIRGVWRQGRRWQAVVYLNRRIAYRESFETIAEAAEAVVAARLRLHTHNDADRVTVGQNAD